MSLRRARARLGLASAVIRNLAGRLRWLILAIAFSKLFRVFEFIGVHITQNHFYSPIPDTRQLGTHLWLRHSELVGLDMREEAQAELLELLPSTFGDEYEALPREKPSVPSQYYLHNGSFGPVDGEMLYCMVRHFKPNKVIEIGSGSSSLLIAEALLTNQKLSEKAGQFVVIDPYPGQIVRRGFPGLSQLKPVAVETVSISEFTCLEENDILFIDSSHVVKVGNDVQYEYLEILPRLRRGVVVHIHDIFLPKEYPEAWVRRRHIFWNEQYLVQAFLSFNDSYEVLWAGSYMHFKHPELLERAFGSYRTKRSVPGSFWIRRKA